MARKDLAIVVEVHKMEEVKQIIELVGKAEKIFVKIGSSVFDGNKRLYLVAPEYIYQVDRWLRDLNKVLPKLEEAT